MKYAILIAFCLTLVVVAERVYVQQMLNGDQWAKIKNLSSIVKANSWEMCAIRFHKLGVVGFFKFETGSRDCVFGPVMPGVEGDTYFWPVVPQGQTQDVVTFTAYDIVKPGK